MRVIEAAQDGVELKFEFQGRRGWAGEQPVPIDLLRDLEPVKGQLGAVAWVLRELADDPDRISWSRGTRRVLDVVPDEAGDDAGSICQREPHEVRAGPRPTVFAVTDEQHLVDGVAVLEIADVADLGSVLRSPTFEKSSYGTSS